MCMLELVNLKPRRNGIDFLPPVVTKTSQQLVCNIYARINHPGLQFCTKDWIEDSILERKRRLRTSRAVELSHRGPNGEITLSWLWAQFTKAIVASQTWLVVSLAGEL